TDFEVPADLVVVAFGFEGTPLPKEYDLSSLRTTDSGTLVVDAHMMTNLEGVFAGGDIIRGPGLVVHAVRDARNAAIEIHRYLGCKRFGELCPDQTDHVSGEGA
ncbi:MAG: FAD-dependent oxidoreductase, partial [Limisphaerales bacterium]